ncbi:galanin receptor type 2-like [Gigantopelta aegis]|uniref:galanin receptor type 2-like n=1 Tax=Gigantopelta aegis TaxID=1735272 RepID=UPI001B88CDB9|nr:galanin receptor type 2-like [Gigantopelta aegis]
MNTVSRDVLLNTVTNALNESVVSATEQSTLRESDTSISYTQSTSAASLSHEDYIEFVIAQKIDLIYLPIVTTLGIIGNVTSTFVLLCSSFRESTTCIYLSTIEILDTFVLMFCIVFFINDYTDEQVINKHSCAVIYFLFYFVIHFDVLVLLAMTVERYIVVRFPLHVHRVIGWKQTVVVIALVGVLSFGINLHSVFIRSMVPNTQTGKSRCWTEGDLNVFFLSRVYPWIDSTIYCFLPVTILFILNVLIIRRTTRAYKRRQSLTGPSSSARQRQVSTMLILVTSAFLVLTAPIAVQLIVQRYALIPRTAHEKAINLLVHAVTDNLMYTNHACNFIFYCISGQRFRNELRRVMCGIAFRRQPSRVLSSSRHAHPMSQTTSLQDVSTIEVAMRTDF